MKNLNSALIPTGFWCEHYGEPFPSIFDAPVENFDISDLVKIIDYLTKGAICIVSPGLVKSAFDQNEIAGSSSIKTDGKWMWPDTLPYYVREHGIALPVKFFEFIRSRNYVAPKEDEIVVNELKFA